MMRGLLPLLIAATLPAQALAGTLRMPDYFIDYAIEMTVATELVAACPDLGLDPMGLNRVNVAVEAKLHEDGLLHPDDEAFAAQVRDSLAADERMAQGLDAIYQRIGVDPSMGQGIEASERWCAAGRAEMQAASSLGRLLYDMR